MNDYGIAILCAAAGMIQLGTVKLVPLPLMRAAKRVAAVGLGLAAAKYAYAGFSGIDLAKGAITALPLILLAMASIMEAWSLIFEQERYSGENRRHE